jgi:hypothetical protein
MDVEASVRGWTPYRGVSRYVPIEFGRRGTAALALCSSNDNYLVQS